MTEPPSEPVESETFSGNDWYAEELDRKDYVDCEFFDIDLTEATVRGCTFTSCHFANVRFNASKHLASAYVGCSFVECNFFDATFTGCKLTGSSFRDCALRPMRVSGGDWSFVVLAGADLIGDRFEEVRMRETDLGHAKCAKSRFTDVDLVGAILEGADFAKADLRGSDLPEFDPPTVGLCGAIVLPEQAMFIAQLLGVQIAERTIERGTARM